MRGHDARPLLDVFGDQRETVLDPHGRCDWNRFAEFQDRVEELLGGARAMEEMVAALMGAHPFMRILGCLVASVRSLYIVGMERVGRSAIPHLAVHVQDLADTRLSVEVVVPARCRGSLAFHHGSVGLMRVYPTMLGLPEATLDAEVTPHRFLAHITPPASRDLASRFRGSLARVACSLRGADPPDYQLEVLDETDIDHRSREIAVTMASAQDIPGLADRIHAIFREVWCADWIRLEWRVGAGLEGLERGGPRPERVCARALTVGDREIGRLLVDKPALLVDSDSPMLKRLIAYLSAVLDNLSRLPPVSWTARAEQIATSWELPRRQQEAFRLLLSGLSNKEIAAAMGCTVKGIEAHVSRLLRRAGVTTRAELIAHCSWQHEPPLIPET